MSVKGSSPLTRGKPTDCHVGGTARGLIPAHAGKTLWVSGGRSSRWAHPRSRGENWRTGALTAWLWGSSPLTRGKRCGRPCPTGGAGLIPAHAGKTTSRTGSVWGRRAHPRSRGENPIF